MAESLPTFEDAISSFESEKVNQGTTQVNEPANDNQLQDTPKELPTFDDALKSPEHQAPLGNAIESTLHGVANVVHGSWETLLGHTVGTQAQTNEGLEYFYKKNAVGRVINAFGQSFGEDFGPVKTLGLSDEDIKGIDKNLGTDWLEQHKTFSQAFIQPKAIAIDAAWRSFSASFPAAQQAIVQTGEEIGGKTGRGLATEIALIPEAFPTGITESMGLPHPVGPYEGVPHSIVEARANNVIGVNEKVFRGVEEPTPEQHVAQQQAAQAMPQAPEPVTPPNIHDVARTIAPETFKEYDALDAKQQVLRAQIANDHFGEQIENSIAELEKQRDELYKVPTDLEGEELHAKVQESLAQQSTHEAELDAQIKALRDGKDDAVAQAAAQARDQIQQLDYRKRDLAPQVSEAYRNAENHIPETAKAEEPLQSVAPKVQDTAEVESQKTAIAADVQKQLEAAGRPTEEAAAASKLVAAYYQARAERFGGKMGTAQELYKKDGANIKAGRQTKRARELAQKQGRELPQGSRGKIRLATDQAKATITLMKDANASTFIHETGHQWLEHLMQDAESEHAPADLVNDAKIVREWLGANEGEIPTRAHEKFARGFERYLMEGTAPSKELASVFAKFKDWLTKIYQSVTALKSPINADIRDVFDRLLAKNPEKTVLAPDHEPGKMLADIHEEDARDTLPEHAAPVRDNVEREVDHTAKLHEPEVADVIKSSESAASPSEVEGAIASNSQDGTGTKSATGETGASEESGAKPTGSSDAGGKSSAAPSQANAKLASDLYKKVPKPPISLADWVRARGGIKDAGGDMRHQIGGVKSRPGLINNKSGRNPDDMALAAWESGYFPDHPERPDINDFLEALDEDVRGNRKYSSNDLQELQDFRDAIAHNDEVDKLSTKFDIETTGKTAQQFWDEVAEKTSIEDQSKMLQEWEADASDAIAEAEQKEREWIESRGESWEPEQDNTRTLEELENEWKQESTARESQQITQSSKQPESTPGSQESAQGSPKQNGVGAKPSGRTQQEAQENAESVLPASRSDLIDKAGNIRLDNLNTPQDVNEVLHQAAEENGGFLDARRGVLSDDQVSSLADSLGMNSKSLSARKLGEAFSAEQIIAARKLLIQSATNVRDLMGKAATGSEADLMAYAEAKARHRMIQEQVSGITAEAGRALRAFRSLDGSAETKALGDFLEQATGRTLNQLKDEAKLGASLDTPQKVSKFINDSYKPSFGEQILEYWINGLISGPATHTTYMVGNTISALWKAIPETAAANLMSRINEMRGKGGSGISLGEIGARLKGGVEGLPEALSSAGKSLKSGLTTLLPEEEAKGFSFQQNAELPESPRMGNEARSWNQLGQDAFSAIKGLRDGFIAAGELIKAGGVEGSKAFDLVRSPLGTIPDISIKGIEIPFGSALRVPGRAIAGIHSFFRAANYSMEKAAIAYRTAEQEGLNGAEAQARIADIMQNPSVEIMAEARKGATDMTLMGQGGALTKAVGKLTNVEANLPGIGRIKLLKFIDPFVHISSNIIEQSLLRRTPIGILSSEIRADLSGANGAVARDFAQGRMLVGTTLAMTVGGLAAEGLVSGSGPSDPKENAAWRMLGGNQPHSVRIGDIWYDAHKLGPLGLLVGVAADLQNVAHEAEHQDLVKVASELVHAISHNIMDESFMRGPAELIKAVTDSERYGDAYIRNFASSFVPFSVGMSQEARAIDPYSRQTRTTMEAIKAKIPYVSEELYPRRDVWGQPIANKAVLGPAGFSAIYETKVSKDPTNLALLSLGIFPSQPQRKVRGVELTEAQYDSYSYIAGTSAKMALDSFVNQPGFDQIPVEQKIPMIKKIIEGTREQARAAVMMQNPDIINQAVANKRKILQPAN